MTPKNLWKSISVAFPSKNKSLAHILLKDPNTGLEIERDNIPNHMKLFFTNIGPNLAKHHTSRWRYFGPQLDNDIPEFLTDVEEVITLCREIEIIKSYLTAHSELAFFLMTGKEPLWSPFSKEVTEKQLATIAPFPYSPSQTKLEKLSIPEFRNFSMISLTEHQGGFRKGFSTTSIIADLTDDLFTEINRGWTTVAAFIDLKKAFVTVDTNILLKKLVSAGIRGKTLDWCTSYLTGRSQKTVVNSQTSTENPIVYGVPQGSVLGPLFFLIYINDLHYALGPEPMLLHSLTLVYHGVRHTGVALVTRGIRME